MSDLKQREGDQPLPVRNTFEDIQSRVITDINERRLLGIQRYGTALQPHNGRDALRDLYEELLDGAMYAKQLMVERQTSSLMAESDLAERAHRAAEEHLDACFQAMSDLEEGYDASSPAMDAFCGCQTCIIREILYAVWDMLRVARP